MKNTSFLEFFERCNVNFLLFRVSIWLRYCKLSYSLVFNFDRGTLQGLFELENRFKNAFISCNIWKFSSIGNFLSFVLVFLYVMGTSKILLPLSGNSPHKRGKSLSILFITWKTIHLTYLYHLSFCTCRISFIYSWIWSEIICLRSLAYFMLRIKW